MKRDSLKTQIARIAAVRTRETYRAEKLRLLGELSEARRRGENPAEFLTALEGAALVDEALGRRRP